ncbi:hypothetical protein EMCRGX_G023872 [Ephydatia muelleri]
MCIVVLFACRRATAEPCNTNEASQLRDESTNSCNSTCTNDDIILEGGSVPTEGIVLVCVDGRSGLLCDDDWSDYDSAVVCRQLGISASGANYYFGNESKDIVLEGVNCTGSETKLKDCPNNTANCTNRRPVGVKCAPNSFPGAPQNISANVFNSTSIIISWRPPLAEQTYGAVLQYNLSCTSPVLNSTGSISPNTTSQQVVGLFPYSMYTCCVCALNSYGWGTYACIQVTTPPSVLTQNPTNFSVSVVNSTCIVLKWSPPVLSWYNGPLLNYSIEIIPQMDTTQRSLISTVQTFLIVSSLHPFYNYTCTVMAYTAAGKGPSTLPITVTTLQDVPSGPPVRFKATANGATSIAMEWGPPAPSKQNGIILGYTVSITAVMTGQIQRLNTTNTSIIVGLLTPYSDYYCSVAAKTPIGSGPEAIPLPVRTMEGAPTGPPLNISHSTPNPSTLILNWSPPDPSYRNGVVRGYLVVISEMETSRPLYFNTSTPPLSIPSLHPFYTYNCSVSAYTVGLPGPYSPPYLVRMPQSAPTSPPLNLSLVASTSTSVTLSWAPPPTQYQNGVIMGYTLQIFNSQQGLLRETNTSSNGSTEDSLRPYTTYLFRVAAMTVAGRGPYSGNVTIITQPSAPTSSPLNLSPVASTSTSVTLSWAPPPTQFQNGVIMGYTLQVFNTQQGLLRETNTSSNGSTVDSLRPYTTYLFRVAAMTVVERGPYSGNVTVLTKEDVPSCAPNVVSLKFSPRSIQLNLNAPLFNCWNGLLTQYLVQITENNTGNILTKNFSIDPLRPNLPLNVTSLHPYYTYECVVAVATVVGPGPFSVAMSGRTNEDVPDGPPVNITITKVTPYSVTLQWDPPTPDKQNGVIVSYVINVMTSDQVQRMVVQSNASQQTISNLTPYTTYTFRISASTRIGQGPFSAAVATRTSETGPTSPPLNLSPVASTSTNITLSWAPPPTQYQNGVIMGYTLQVFNTQQGLLRETNTSSNGSTVDSLRPYTTYLFRVAAMTVAGRGPYSGNVTVLTKEDVPSCAPNVVSLKFSPRSVQLNLNAPLFNCWNGLLTQYLVRITENNTGSILTKNFSIDPLRPNLPLNVTSLHPYYTYECVVAVATVVGPGPFSVAMSGRTNEDVPDGPPVNITIIEITPYSVTLQWDPPTPDKQNGVIVSYVINVMTGDQVQRMVVQSNDSQQTISNLTLYTTYTFSISASTRIGQGPSISYVVTTSETSPTGPPLNISYSTPNPSTLILNWSPPDPSYRNGVVRGYLVVISEMETSRPLYFNTSTPPLSIPSLHPFYTYNCSVSAYTVGLPGPYSSSYLVRMPQSAPTSPPLYLSPVASTSTNITLSWAPPPTQYQNGVIMGYTLQVFNSQQGLLRETNTSSNGSTVDSLNPDTTYLFKVAAMTVVGRGPYSDNVYVATRQFVPVIPPNVSTAVRLNAEAILLSWEPMATDTTQGAFIGYSVRYRPFTDVAKRDTNQGYTITSTKETQITISFLDPTSAYMVGVAAATQAGIGVYSQSTVGLYENSLFQVYMQAPGVVCKEWMSYGVTDKTKDIVSQISSNLGSSFPITYIGDVGLLCDKQQLNWVVLTGRAVGTRNLNSSGMVHQLQEWVLTSPKVTSQGVMLQVLASCPLSLTQLRSPSCTVPMGTTSSTTPVISTVSSTELTSVVSVSVGIGGVLLVLVLVVMAIILYVRRKTRATFIISRDMTLTSAHNVCHEMDTAAVAKETNLDESIYASIGDLHKPAEGSNLSGGALCETAPRRARALSNQYFDASITPLLCLNMPSDCNGTLTVVSEEPPRTAPLPPPRLVPLLPTATTSEQLYPSVSSPNLASETVSGGDNSQPRCSTPSLAVYTDLSTQMDQSGQKTSKSLPTDLCTVTAGPSLLCNSTEDIYIEMIGESAA